MRIFMGGDVCAEAGLVATERVLSRFVQEQNIDFVVINGENAAGGYGIEQAEFDRIIAAGANVITGGNHIFEKRSVYPLLESDTRIIRPANYPPRVPGHGFTVMYKNTIPIAVINLHGREGMTAVDCPFRCADSILEDLKKQTSSISIILVDFHAESNEEKEALALYLDGRVSAVCGTHTHIQTADERILPHGTAYITDLGLTGPVDSVIGGNPAASVLRHSTGIMRRIEPATGRSVVQGVVLDIQEDGIAQEIHPVTLFADNL